eukprot:gnl/MRDRNA2_/MRDRNA2_27040_c0_seq1.p1 gnl/MRDRNA2_/MRDRNA2_27040_c0~~gnl/MRDRNA2_/MRDRNA2_27040_c0_seq1.p1  ORF type:complete len:625 (-),score=113.26 gnl/MRDRNA2_/MRDRNA2_27040_c0_seq1:177-2051(-)
MDGNRLSTGSTGVGAKLEKSYTGLNIGWDAYEEQKFLHLQQLKEDIMNRRADHIVAFLDYGFTAVVVANIAMMVVETDGCGQDGEGCSIDFNAVESVFLVVYILELLFRLKVFQRQAQAKREEEEQGPESFTRSQTNCSTVSGAVPSTPGSRSAGNGKRASYVETAKNIGSMSKSFKVIRAATVNFKRSPFESAKRCLISIREKLRSAHVLNLAIRDHWFLMDFTLVLAGVLDIWILALADEGHESSPQILVLRLVRILRLVKVVRYFPQLWLLVNGMLSSAKAVLWLGLLMCGFVFTNALFLTRALYSDGGLCRESFGSVLLSFQSLWRILTLDDWHDIITPVMDQGDAWFWYFLGFIVVGNFFTLAVFTAIVVQTTSTVAINDDLNFIEDMKSARMATVDRLTEIFAIADSDGNGQLNLNEFKAVLQKEQVSQIFREMQISKSDIEWLFSILDADDSGDIAIKEFVGGILKVKDSELTRGLLQLQFALSGEIRRRAKKSNEELQKVVQCAVAEAVAPLHAEIKELKDQVRQQPCQVRSDQKVPSKEAPDSAQTTSESPPSGLIGSTMIPIPIGSHAGDPQINMEDLPEVGELMGTIGSDAEEDDGIQSRTSSPPLEPHERWL